MTIRVEITTQQAVRLAKTVDMEQSDFDEYNRLIESELSTTQLDAAIEDLAQKYGLGGNDVFDWDEMEDIEFNQRAVG